MKFPFYLIFSLFSVFSFAQDANNYDFFVQYNGDQLTKKVSVGEVLNHSALKEFNKSNDEFTANEFDAIVDLTQKITFLGNYTDSIKYTQYTIPLKNSDLLKEILLRKKVKKDSLEVEKEVVILDFGSFSMVQSDSLKQGPTIAWNKDYLVIYELNDQYNYTDFVDMKQGSGEFEVFDVDELPPPPPAPTDEENEVIYGVPYEESAEPTVIVEVPEVDEDYLEEDSSYETYLNQKATFDKLKTQNQETYVESLFENGFVAPHSDKVNLKADISTWINYSSFIENFSKLYSSMDMFTGVNSYLPYSQKMGDFVKGINFNTYFDNNKVRLEETIEYDEEMAKTVEKISNRKINKNIYSYFPDQSPIGYASYHFDSEELLKNVPLFTNRIFSESSPLKEDLALIMDLITTIVDEKATATLFDGDATFFLHDVKSKERTIKEYEYDENYEQVEVERIKKESFPVFSFVFTSSHPTFGDKLVDLGLRKGLLKAKDGLNYIDMKTDKYGDVFIVKDKDVIVIGNYSENLKKNSNNDFTKEVKKKLKKNSLIGEVSFEKIAEVNQELSSKNGTSAIQFEKFSRHFKTFEMHSPKKLKDNKFSFEMSLNATNADKNTILQFLDIIAENK